MTKPVTSKALSLPAPMGLNLIDSPGALLPGECLVLRNCIRAKNGARIRPGLEMHYASGATESARTTFGFEGSTAAKARLFVSDVNGIKDVTVEAHPLWVSPAPSAPTGTNGTSSVFEGVAASVDMAAMRVGLGEFDNMVVTFGTQSGNAGYGIARAFTTLAGEHYLYYADEENGLYYYKESTDAWTKPTDASTAGNFYGIDPANFAFVTVWKKRLWFVKKDSTLAYYLPVNQYAGTLDTFDFGPQFKHGGHLVGLWSWTLDAGEGVDDMLVAISSSGDVVIYQGTDPNYFPEIRLKGVWYVGKVPAGRRIATEHGGDLLILSTMGMIPLSKIVSGEPISSPGLYATYKIGPAFQEMMSQHADERGWSVVIDPLNALLIVLTPWTYDAYANVPYRQWVMALTSGAWSEYREVPMISAEPWKGKLYIGSDIGDVYRHEGNTDQLWDGFRYPIQADILYGYQNAETPLVKRLLMARARFQDADSPAHLIWGRTGYDTSDVPDTVRNSWTNSYVTMVTTWNADYQRKGWRGITGIGSDLSIALSVSAEEDTGIAGVDVLVDVGGLL